MKKPRVTVTDYGIGNLLSVQRALEHCGAEVEMSSEPAALERAERVVVPGVGAFRDCMAGLHAHGFVEPLRRYAARERPLLGICVGMQVLFDSSEEFGLHPGLGLIPGKVVAIPRESNGVARKTPHIGWSALRPGPAANGWSRSILQGLAPGRASAYFVHSYSVEPADPALILAQCEYDGCTVTAAVVRGAAAGCQFHPEKSGETGLTILRNFCAL